MHTLTRDDIEQAARQVYQVMPATAQYAWPLLAERLGCTVWVKHENHTPTGAFKVRGGITFMHWLKQAHPEVKGIVSATRGNHGQSVALAATAVGLRALIVVPLGNSVEKNNAMRGFGGEVVEFGRDFDEAREEAARLAQVHGLYLVPPFHGELVKGVATYALELFSAAPDLHTVYVPIGCGSGICAVIAARDAAAQQHEHANFVGAAVTKAREQPGRGQHGHGHGHHEARADPLHPRLAQREMLAHVGDGHVHDGGRHHRRHGAQHDRQQQQPAVPLAITRLQRLQAVGALGQAHAPEPRLGLWAVLSTDAATQAAQMQALLRATSGTCFSKSALN